jgi:2,4-dienoyl-CoA reductase-like NADH-dependent reductase (Old Yellow Enzyme family)
VGQKQDVYYKEAAARFKEKIGVPLLLVGGIRSLEIAEQIVRDRLADYISMSRPLIREPNLINRWKSGDTEPATCVSCNGCFGAGFKGEGVHCVFEGQ